MTGTPLNRRAELPFRTMIVYCCKDLLFATRIGSTAEHHGFPARPARQLPQLLARLEQVDDGKANGPVTLVLVDLDLAEAAIASIRAAQAHRAQQPPQDDTAAAMRIVAFGSHTDTETLRAAKAAGADLALPRSLFVQQLLPLLQQADAAARPPEEPI